MKRGNAEQEGDVGVGPTRLPHGLGYLTPHTNAERGSA